MHAEQALDRFRAAMLAKLQLRDARRGDSSVMRRNVSEVFDFKAVWTVLEGEIHELRLAPEDVTEAVDVANGAFLLWWWLEERGGGA